MEDDNISQIKFKNTINDLFTYEKKYRTHTRAELMKQIKNLILSNENLNHREIHFNYKNEYTEMNKTMKKFNRNSNENKKIITELTKENDFFSKSYSNMISSMITKLENKNINYQTITNFNEKYMNKSNKDKHKNFFFQNPLLLTKKKDMNNFYLHQKDTDEEKDQFLQYSKKILNKINHQYPSLKINNIINEYNNKTNYRFNINKKSSKRNVRFNTFYGQKNLIKKISKDNLINKNILKINKNFFDENNDDLNDKNKPNEKKIIKKKSQNYNTKIKIDSNNQEKSKSNKNNLFIELKRNIKYKTSRNNNLKINPLTERNTNKSSNKLFVDKLLKIGLNNKEINNLKEKNNKYEVKKISKIKGSIQIKNIYDDYVKTKNIIDDYKKSNTTKLKYLYYSSGKKNLKQFNKNERENNRINNLGYNLFWTINK